MAKILVLIDGVNGKASRASLCAISAASELSAQWFGGAAEIVGCSCAAGITAPVGKLITVSGVAEAQLSEQVAAVLTYVAEQLQADAVVIPATSFGREVGPVVAAALSAAQLSDVTAILSAKRANRLMYAGNVIAEVEATTPRVVVTVRPTAFQPAQGGSSTASETVSLPADKLVHRIQFVSFESAKSERPQLGDASVVVSGGRALGSKEKFIEVLGPLADALQAALGASRAAVDSGYAPNDWQVGQTGKIVAPQLYLAVGLSGAVQHLAGMKDSKVIVAINKDPQAPIFEVADFGLVADLFTAVPELAKALVARRG